jgi:AAA+ superfamily predicted ATPase
LNLYNAVDRNSPEGRAINRWMQKDFTPLQAPRDLPLSDDLDHVEADHYLATPEVWRDINLALQEAAAYAEPPPDVESAWIAVLGAKLRLDTIASRILALVVYYECHAEVRLLWDTISYYRRSSTTKLRCGAGRIANLLGVRASEVTRQLLVTTAPLVESGLLQPDFHHELHLCKQLRLLLDAEIWPGSDLNSQLLSAAAPATLPWRSFAHIGPEAEIAASVLRAAIAREECGINILLYGPPGTGKTSFAATLAANVDAKLCMVGTTDQYGGEPMRHDRISGLRLAQYLATRGNSVLLFDEAEDLVIDGDNRFRDSPTPSRTFTHRLLEQNRVPVIWTANYIGILGPAVLRRMTMCVEMRVPGINTRATLWRDMAQLENLTLAEEDASRLARLVAAAPAVAATALRATRLAGGDAGTVHLIVEGITRAVHGGYLPTPELPADRCYNPALINADCDLVSLTERLCHADSPKQVSFLVSGPPGTGKSAWVRHLADRMGMPVLQKRASDLLGRFVGETEKNIASAFAEARSDRAFLIFDEADSLLFNRSHAMQSWETSQINEMLTWMSEHTYPFACTTNLLERLDTASLRRFLFKIRLGWLRPAQARTAFHTFFGLTAPPTLDALTTLAPSDFALVRRLAGVTGASADAAELVRLLAAECRGRTGGSNEIGFLRQQDQL